MRPLRISRDIIPLAQFKRQTSKIFRRLREEQRPIVVTQNGQPAAVLISPEEFDRLQEHDRFLGAVQKGLSDSEAGHLIDDEELSTDLGAKFGT